MLVEFIYVQVDRIDVDGSRCGRLVVGIVLRGLGHVSVSGGLPRVVSAVRLHLGGTVACFLMRLFQEKVDISRGLVLVRGARNGVSSEVCEVNWRL